MTLRDTKLDTDDIGASRVTIVIGRRASAVQFFERATRRQRLRRLIGPVRRAVRWVVADER
jgi:hypothetical protein